MLDAAHVLAEGWLLLCSLLNVLAVSFHFDIQYVLRLLVVGFCLTSRPPSTAGVLECA
jgi:hypothetical protein